MKKLTNREIVRIHDMHRMGQRPHEISRALEISRNTVTAHLRGDVTYPLEVRRKISQASPLVADGWLCRRLAAPWIPGHPSPAKMRVLMTSTSWMGRNQKPPLKSKIVNGRRVTKIAWLREYVAEHFPIGIWVHSDTLVTYADVFPAEPPTILSRRLLGYQLCVATRIAMDAGRSLELPPALIHRAVQIEHHVGMALV